MDNQNQPKDGGSTLRTLSSESSNQPKKVLCKCCSSEIANLSNGKVIFNNMKAISILEVSIIDYSKDVKCRNCGNWNSFDTNNNQTVNHSRKSKDVLFGYERNVAKFRGNGKDK